MAACAVADSDTDERSRDPLYPRTYDHCPLGENADGPTPKEALDRVLTDYENKTTGLGEDALTRATIAKMLGLPREVYTVLHSVNVEGAEIADKPERAAFDLDTAEIEFHTGYIEDAYLRLRQIETRFGDRFEDPEFVENYRAVRMSIAQKVQQRLNYRMPVEGDFRRAFRQLKVRVCFVLGKFTEAIQEEQSVLQELERSLKNRMTPDLLKLAEKLPTPSGVQLFDAACYCFSESQPSGLHRLGSEMLVAVRNENLKRISSEIQAVESIQVLHIRIAMLNLEKGNNTEAKFHFEQSMKPAGIEFPGRFQGLARSYLEVLKNGE